MKKSVSRVLSILSAFVMSTAVFAASLGDNVTGMPVITAYAASSKTSHNFSNYFKTDCELGFSWDKDKNVDHWRVYMYYPEKGKYFLEGETKEKYFYKESL